jgi:NAD(P)H-hydrate epimerase
VRPPFDAVLETMRKSPLPLCSVDIPSGWHVEQGPVGEHPLMPQTLISLTAPKLGSAHFTGHHWLGGRFVPPPIFEKYGFQQPEFPAAEQVVLLSAAAAAKDEM